MPTTIITETKDYITCPACATGKHLVSHLYEESHNRSVNFGPWYCDQCGQAISGVVKDCIVAAELMPGVRKRDTVVFLRYSGIIFAVKGMRFNNDQIGEGNQYLYEEHHCPTNITNSIVGVITYPELNTDQHGLFDYIGTVEEFNTDNACLLVDNLMEFKDKLSCGE